MLPCTSFFKQTYLPTQTPPFMKVDCSALYNTSISVQLYVLLLMHCSLCCCRTASTVSAAARTSLSCPFIFDYLPYNQSYHCNQNYQHKNCTCAHSITSFISDPGGNLALSPAAGTLLLLRNYPVQSAQVIFLQFLKKSLPLLLPSAYYSLYKAGTTNNPTKQLQEMLQLFRY